MVGLCNCWSAPLCSVNAEPNCDQAGEVKILTHSPSLGVPNAACPLSATTLRPPELTHGYGMEKPSSSPNCILIHMMMMGAACYCHLLKNSFWSPYCEAVGNVCQCACFGVIVLACRFVCKTIRPKSSLAYLINDGWTLLKLKLKLP